MSKSVIIQNQIANDFEAVEEEIIDDEVIILEADN